MSSSPKLDRYKIARQLTEKAIKVNGFGDSGVGVVFKKKKKREIILEFYLYNRPDWMTSSHMEMMPISLLTSSEFLYSLCCQLLVPCELRQACVGGGHSDDVPTERQFGEAL